jgi:serine/threonine protein phosphatase PrpC
MARTLMIGLTESGQETKINEDAFLCGGRIYPDMLGGNEEQSLSSGKYHQLYMIAEGFGGPGAGDLASRMVLRIGNQMLDQINDYKNPDLDFKQFTQDLLAQAHASIKEMVSSKFTHEVGCSFALLLIDANSCYTLNVGNTTINLSRNGEIYRLTDKVKSDIPEEYLGKLSCETLPVPDSMSKCDLQPGDVFVLSSSGFNKNYRSKDLRNDLAKQDAFAAIVRQAQINSGARDKGPNRTIVAVKTLDLQLELPQGPSPVEAERKRIFSGETVVEEEVQKAEADMNNYNRYENEIDGDAILVPTRKQKAKTFFMSLLLGFVLGLAILLIAWFFIL